MTRLDAGQIAAVLVKMPAWRHDPAREAIVRDFVFVDFAEAFAFMTQLALAAEQRNHHPDWRNVYNRVEIALTTHEAGGITEKDVAFALYADRVYERFGHRG